MSPYADGGYLRRSRCPHDNARNRYGCAAYACDVRIVNVHGPFRRRVWLAANRGNCCNLGRRAVFYDNRGNLGWMVNAEVLRRPRSPLPYDNDCNGFLRERGRGVRMHAVREDEFPKWMRMPR